jgi:hypothetical protein
MLSHVLVTVDGVQIGNLIYWTPCTCTIIQLGTPANYSATGDFHTFQFTVAHALGFSVSASRTWATGLDTGTIT